MTPPRSPSRTRRLLIGAPALLAILAAAHTVLWVIASNLLQNEALAWVAQTRAAGWTISLGPGARAGWPLAAGIVLPDVSLARVAPGGQEVVAWRADTVELSVALLRPDTLRIGASGQQRLHLPGLAAFDFTADRLNASIRLHPGRPSDGGDLAVTGLRAALPTGELRIATLAAAADLPPEAAAAATLTASAAAISLPPLPAGRAWPFGPRVASASFEAALTGRLPPPSRPSPASLAAVAAGWRDEGGTLEVRRLAIGWGPLGVSAIATLRLDARLQPEGSGTARLVGTNAALDALASSALLAPRAVQAVRGVLTLLARPPEGGGAPQVELPLSLQDRTLVAGGFPLLRFGEWVWP